VSGRQLSPSKSGKKSGKNKHKNRKSKSKSKGKDTDPSLMQIAVEFDFAKIIAAKSNQHGKESDNGVGIKSDDCLTRA